MNKKIPVQIAQGISLVATFIFVFLGTLYAHNAWLLSIVVSALCVIVAFFLINHFIEEKEVLNRVGYSTKTYVFLLFYALMTLPTSFYVVHALNVEVTERYVAVENAKKKCEYLSRLESQYTIEYKSFLNDYKSSMTNLLSAASSKRKYGMSTATEEAQLTRPPFTLNRDAIRSLMNASNFQSINTQVNEKDTIFKTKLVELTSVYPDPNVESEKITQWNRLKVLTKLEELEKRMQTEKDSLDHALNRLSAGKRSLQAFTPPQIANDLIRSPVQLFFSKPNSSVFAFVIVFQALLILPYWLTRKPAYNKIKRENEIKGSSEVSRSKGPGVDI